MSDLHLIDRRDDGTSARERHARRARPDRGAPVERAPPSERAPHGPLPEPQPATVAPRRSAVARGLAQSGGRLLILAGILAAGYAAYASLPAPGEGGRRGGRFAADGPVPVLVEPVRRADVPVTLDAVGTVQALNSVLVRPQVDGKLLSIDVREGQEVRRGDVIAHIDPTTFQAQYDQTVAQRNKNEATLENARRDLQRSLSLIERNYASRQTADTQQAAVAQLEAQVRSDQASIDNAKAVLGYTTVRAPIDGRTGLRQIDEGNIVRSGDGAGLITITQMKPIALTFNVAQQHLRAVNAARAKGEVVVEALDADNRTTIERGRLDVVDNIVDPTTGTVRMKAVFPNADLALWPGQFTNVRVTVRTLEGAVVAPTAAVQRGPKGAFVYVLDDERARQRPVTVAQQDDRLAVVEAGVQPGERLITTGFARLTDGEAVRVTDPAAPAPVASESPRSGRAWGGRREGGEAGRREGGRGERRGSAQPAPAPQ